MIKYATILFSATHLVLTKTCVIFFYILIYQTSQYLFIHAFEKRTHHIFNIWDHRGSDRKWLDFSATIPKQSVPITTDVVSSNLDQDEVYNITVYDQACQAVTFDRSVFFSGSSGFLSHQ